MLRSFAIASRRFTSSAGQSGSNVISASQKVKDIVRAGPRFEQTDMAAQPNPLSAMKLISEVPTKLVPGRRISCDGGGGALGHPKVYLNLDDGTAVACGYCGLAYQKDPHHGHH